MLQTLDLPTDLMTAQRDIELRASQAGYDRYIKQQDGADISSECLKLIKGSLPIVSENISAWLLASDRKGKGKNHAAVAVLKRLDPDLLAFLSLNSIFAGISQENSVTSVQTLLGGQVEAELMALEIEDTKGAKVTSRIKATTAKQGSARNKKKVFAKLAGEHLPDHEGWTQDIKVRIAEPLVNATLLALPDLLEVMTIPKAKNHSDTVIRLTDEGVAMFSQLRESMAWMQPIHRPMVVPPRPWTGYNTGCYFEDRAARTVSLVRTYNKDHKKLIKDAIAAGQMDYIIAAVNTVQSTAWAINKPILNLVEWAFNEGIPGLGLPSNDLMPVPAKLPQDTWEAMDTKARKGHRLALSGIHERNRGTVSDQSVLLRDLETAKELTDYHSFWLPHNLDFRGRVYPVPHFSHQRADHIKAMFQFAKGEELGEFGIGWLSVHLANCGDFDKVSKATFDDRLQWVEDNEGMILNVGSDPYTFRDWMDADSPFMFVAACMEYARWVDAGRKDTFVSHLAVALDGSNSGLQHYAAALRSYEEASLVSLTDNAKPSDLYQTIADKVVAVMLLEVAEGNELARQCLEAGITRSIVKRNVMTFAYSSEQFGFRQQLMDDLMKPINDKVFTGQLSDNPFATFRKDKETGEATDVLDGGFTASGYIAAKVWQAVTETVTKATEGMDYFKRLAATLAHEKQPLIWTTPLGLPVMHKYSIWETKKVELTLYDRSMPVISAKLHDKVTEDGTGVLRRIQLNLRTKPTGLIDKAKARSAVAPNVIHSMDGSHLLLTVLNASYEGLKDFALIHDSFGVHAGKTQRFFQIIRESFVEMYDNYCPFEETHAYACSVLSDEGIAKLPAIPTKGDMDLNVVLDADYAFA